MLAHHAPQFRSLGDSAGPGLPGAALTGVPVAPPRHRLLEPVVREQVLIGQVASPVVQFGGPLLLLFA